MAEHVKGRAIIAVCDISKHASLGTRESAGSGTIVIYRDGREVARNGGESNAAFDTEMHLLGLNAYGGSSQ